MFVGSRFDEMLTDMQQSHAIRLAVSRAIGLAPLMVRRLDGVWVLTGGMLASGVAFVCRLFRTVYTGHGYT
ncbi:MAG: hypothetical protein AB8B64_17315 [Granulosicoccus sp.]